MRIKELTLLTNNLTGTKNFYGAKLGLHPVEEHSDFIVFRTGSTLLTFRLSAIDGPVYHIAFNIPHNKITEALLWCEKHRLHLLSYESKELVDFPNWNAKSIYFTDNGGNILEFIARYDLPNAISTHFGPEHILNVSETGVVVDNVPAFAEQFSKQYGVPYYEKQPAGPNFTVLGDAEGLFIVVPEKRKWFPTSVLSRKFPLQLIFEQGGRDFVFSAGLQVG
jgi:catechol 2,3-dioxygenase-like lactoylglutathione lyase family enzyme